MIAYHGTNNDFEIFSLEGAENPEGFHFTPHKWHAEGYGDIVIKAELSITNPVLLTEDEWITCKVHGEKFRHHFHALGYDGWIVVMSDQRIQEIGVFSAEQITILEKL